MNMSVYGITDGISGLLRFALVAIYTRSFLPEEMGSLSLIATGVTFFIAAVPLALPSVLIIRLPKIEPKKHRIVQSTIFIYLLFLCTGIGLLGLFLSSIAISQAFFVEGAFWVWLWISGTVMAEVPAVSLQYQHKSIRRSLGTLVAPVVTGGIILVLYFTSYVTIKRVIMAEAVGTAMQVVVFMALDSFFPRRWNLKLLPDMLKQGIPLTLFTFGRLIVDLSDRYIIYFLISAGAAGLYAAGTRVALVGFFLVEAFNLTWTPYSLQSISNRRFEISTFQKQSQSFMYCVAGLLCVVGIVLPVFSAGMIFDFALLDPNFKIAAFLVPALLLQYQFKAYYYVFTPLLTYHSMHRELIRTIYIPAILNVAGNCIVLLTLKQYSIFVRLSCVSLVTAVTYGASMLATVFSLKKHYPAIRFPAKMVAGTTACTLIPFVFWFWYAMR